MPTNLYPQTFQEYVTLFGVLTPFIALAGGAIWRAWTYQREQKQKEWERLHELVKTLYNKDGEYGAWAQLAAVHELKTLRIDQAVLGSIVINALDYWTQTGADAQLITELKKVQTSLT